MRVRRVKNVRAIATAAVRDATDGADFIRYETTLMSSPRELPSHLVILDALLDSGLVTQGDVARGGPAQMRLSFTKATHVGRASFLSDEHGRELADLAARRGLSAALAHMVCTPGETIPGIAQLLKIKNDRVGKFVHGSLC